MCFALNVLMVLAVEEGVVCLKTPGTLASVVLIPVFQTRIYKKVNPRRLLELAQLIKQDKKAMKKE